MSKLIKLLKSRNSMAVIGTLIGTVIYCIGVVFILDNCNLYACGVTGIAQIIKNILGIEWPYFFSFMIIVLNIPLFLVSWKGMSRRFAILSLGSVVLQFALTALFSYLTNECNFNPFASMADEKLTLALLGGLFSGAGCGIALRYGASTGGTDVVSQFLSLKKHMNFAKFSISINLIIVFTSLFINVENGIDISTAVYTVISMIIGILVLDKIHIIYKYEKITIVTDEKQRMRDALIGKFNHGLTIYQAMGGYSNKARYVLESVVWNFESNDYIRIAKEIDPNCFIVCTAVTKISGPFKVNIIA